MSSPWEYYLTPTLTLSLLLACEAPPSLSSWLAGWALALARPALLRGTLEWELEREGAAGGVSIGTLRVVDYARWKALGGAEGTPHLQTSSPSCNKNGYERLPSSASDTVFNADATDEDSEETENLSRLIASLEGLAVPSPEHDLLLRSLTLVNRTYALTAAAVDRAATPCTEDGSADPQLRELWRLLRPERDWEGVRGKEWQEVGFQNVSPATDFRAVGMLGLDAFLYFARTYGDRAAEMVDESVGGGEHWYPLALASIHITAFVLDMARSRDLQLLLLRSLPSPTPSSPSLDPLLALSASLLHLFHTHWLSLSPRPSVMQFESVSKDFQARVRPWARRGVVDGRALGWAGEGEGAVKLE
ncbi:hypothetical protein JCM10450v2_001637 [Rhodotorula kratochvilovae]